MRAYAYAIKLVVTKGWRKVGICQLMHGAGSLEYARLERRLVSMPKDTDLPNWREISSKENTEEHSTPIPDAPVDGSSYPHQDWLYSMCGWNSYVQHIPQQGGSTRGRTSISSISRISRIHHIGHAGGPIGSLYRGAMVQFRGDGTTDVYPEGQRS